MHVMKSALYSFHVCYEISMYSFHACYEISMYSFHACYEISMYSFRLAIWRGYHDNCTKSADTWCQCQKDKRDNTIYCKSKGDLLIDFRIVILPIYESLFKSEMLGKRPLDKIQNANESFNGMIWNHVLKAAHVGLDVLSVGVYDAIAHFNHCEKMP